MGGAVKKYHTLASLVQRHSVIAAMLLLCHNDVFVSMLALS